MALTREVSLQTLAVLDQAETDIDRLMGSSQPGYLRLALKHGLLPYRIGATDFRVW